MQYDRTALIRAYLQANQPQYLHEDFKTYSTGLLTALQQAFGIVLSYDGVQNSGAGALWMLFRATAQSYLSIQSPRSHFIDDTLITVTLERLGEQGKQITALETTIQQAISTSATAHLDLLDELFVLLWGATDRLVTSDDLQQGGFDDTQEPKFSDYVDYL
jgi:hypothetical protein